MDWKRLQSDAKTWATKAQIVAEKTLTTGKEYAEKAKTQSYETLVRWPMGLTDTEAFETIKDQKHLAVFCLDENHEITKKMILLFPIVFTKAWVESGTIRIVGSDNKELLDLLDIKKAPSILLFEMGECSRKIEDESEIIQFMKGFSFYEA